MFCRLGAAFSSISSSVPTPPRVRGLFDCRQRTGNENNFLRVLNEKNSSIGEGEGRSDCVFTHQEPLSRINQGFGDEFELVCERSEVGKHGQLLEDAVIRQRCLSRMLLIPALGVSTLYIVLTSLLAYVARKLAHKFINEPFVRALFLEGIASAELCGTCFELIIVADNFGISTYAVYLFCLTIWWSQNWGDATACPYTHLEDVVQGKASLRVAALKIWAELTGGILIYRLDYRRHFTEIQGHNHDSFTLSANMTHMLNIPFINNCTKV
ncbi:unnamed protein product [Timema podura]|uniref:Uncharacterized protein n=1 Tax=Timema podura TaxID=61482 RepID=A0ABN7NLT9_TIMPD|nr:unnamed protein product [Timema podura]